MNNRIAFALVALLLALCGCGVQKESWVQNAAGTYSFCRLPSAANLLEIKVADLRGSEEWIVDTRASCYQKCDVVWIDDATILVASSDVGFLAIDVLNKYMSRSVDVKMVEGKYLVRMLNDASECIRSILVDKEAMPKTTLLNCLPDGRGD